MMKKKKYVATALFATLFLTNCSGVDYVDEDSEKPDEFGEYCIAMSEDSADFDCSSIYTSPKLKYYWWCTPYTDRPGNIDNPLPPKIANTQCASKLELIVSHENQEGLGWCCDFGVD